MEPATQPTATRTPKQVVERGGALFQAGSQSFEFPTLIADGDTVALEWRVRARTTRGVDYDNAYCGIFVVGNGRIRAVREYLDSGYAARTLFGDAALRASAACTGAASGWRTGSAPT